MNNLQVKGSRPSTYGTVEERKKIYKAILLKIEDGPRSQRRGMCSLFADELGFNASYFDGWRLFNLPELWNLRPDHVPTVVQYRSLWYPLNDAGMRARANVLQEAISKCR